MANQRSDYPSTSVIKNSPGQVRSPQETMIDRRLAINGGRPVQDAPKEDFGIVVDAAADVARVIETGRICHWRGGPKTKELEATVASLLGRRGAFFVHTGTAAIMTGLYALGAAEGKAIALSSSGFVATLNAVYHSRARPVFLPTDEKTLVVQSDVSLWIREPIDIALVTQFFGNVVDVDSVRQTSRAQNVLEDASQAFGTKVNGRFVGNRGEVASFSGSQKKLLGSGVGGINVYDDPELGERMRTLAHHGKGHRQYAEVPGFNLFGGEIEATLALHAVPKIDERRSARRNIAELMFEILGQAGIVCAHPPEGVDCEVAWFDVAVILPESWIGHRDWVVEALVAEGVPAWWYPALIDMPWVEPWMNARGWWGDREEELRQHEKRIWDRVFVIATQITPDEARRAAHATTKVLLG